jgi:hypothetical protein
MTICQPLSSPSFPRNPSIWGCPTICAYFASARGEAMVTFEAVVMVLSAFVRDPISGQVQNFKMCEAVCNWEHTR